ncbi:DUF3566 domain-containing protein [Tessaracoccus caeni]|uniref:DUF3566 domain-containing protein n=1 Tax=Tessaracoccus caeni TaxID=3031239 RepID=UPI0023DB653E|nr:DUF3566 domain-containing protein [Tessaracoccus caeni]MDF1488041.1 DUF3566 domain-containing protein [Tessaracoccus caeni]
MSDAPRWPGANGKPDLVFAPADSRERTEQSAEPAGSPEFAAPEPIPTFVTRENPLVPPDVLRQESPAGVDLKLGPVAGTVTSAAGEGETTRQPVVITEDDAAQERAKVRRTRKARLRLSRIDPWSVMKTSFLFSIAFGVMLVVAIFALWSVLASSGALQEANNMINQLIGDGGQSFNIEDYLSMNRIMGLTVVVAAIDVVILTALATLFAFLYNLSATVLGGLEVTLAED